MKRSRRSSPGLGAARVARQLAFAATLASSLTAQARREAASAEARSDSLLAAQKYGEALPLARELVRLDSASAKHWMSLGLAAAGTSDLAGALKAFERSNTLARGPIASYNVAAMFARLHELDSAVVWLDQAVALGFSNVNYLNGDDDFAALRNDARLEKTRYAMTHAPAPCASDSLYRKFDFWVGAWDVTTPGGQRTGSSRVDVVSGGCALLENWTGGRGDEGKSLNTYNSATGAWQQYYVGQGGGVLEYRESEWHDGSISFIARAAATAKRPATINRLTFTPMNDSTVRQFDEISVDGGKTWKPLYDFRYHRRR